MGVVTDIHQQRVESSRARGVEARRTTLLQPEEEEEHEEGRQKRRERK